MSKITDAQHGEYQRAGYLVLPHFVSEADCDRLRARAEELVHAFDPLGLISIFTTKEQNRIADDYFLESSDKIRYFFEADAFLPEGTLKQSKDRSINKIGHALHDLDPIFDKFSRTADLKQLVADLNIDNPLLLQSMYIFKQPRIGGEVGCHQDSTFLYTDPINIAGLWLALEDATIENGCLWVIPAGHKEGLKSRWVRSDSGMRLDLLQSEDWDEGRLVPLEVKKGTLIVLHGLLPHKSRANRSLKSRHAYTLHIISKNSSYPPSNWLQRSDEMPLRGF